MDKKQFREFLETVAEVKDLKPTASSEFRLDENSGGEVRYNDEVIKLGKHSNPTLGFKFVKLKDNNRLCELGCGDIVSNQVIERKITEYPKKHWRTRCKSCGCYVTPDGVGFAKSTEISNIYNKWFNQQKFKNDKEPVEVPEHPEHPEHPMIGNIERIIEIDGKEYLETVTNTSIIRKAV